MGRSLLVIDDDSTIRQSLGYAFSNIGYKVLLAPTAGDGIKAARESQPGIILLDYRLPDKSGLEVLAEIKAAAPDAAVIMLTAFGSIPDAVEAIKRGVFDYQTKPVDMDLLTLAISRAEQVRALKKENRALKDLQQAGMREGIAGASKEIHRLLLMLDMLAENADTTVLIMGESGTGKELAARIIHRQSRRSDKPFVDINCASLSEHLLESELFGHEKGAFTDAKEAKRGLLEIADGGTLFLDEIGELGRALQPKLLRVLETRTFRRVGGTRDIKVDVRIMAATNRDLMQAVREKEFREDLYYRLCVMPITMPPLRERGSDALLLARHFISVLSVGLKKKMSGISPECETYILRYPWPGNVRELKNVIERAVILSPGPEIHPEHLPRELTGSETFCPSNDQPSTLEEAERAHIRKVLDHTGGNHSRTARLLGISRSTLISKLKKYSFLLP